MAVIEESVLTPNAWTEKALSNFAKKKQQQEIPFTGLAPAGPLDYLPECRSAVVCAVKRRCVKGTYPEALNEKCLEVALGFVKGAQGLNPGTALQLSTPPLMSISFQSVLPFGGPCSGLFLGNLHGHHPIVRNCPHACSILWTKSCTNLEGKPCEYWENPRIGAKRISPIHSIPGLAGCPCHIASEGTREPIP